MRSALGVVVALGMTLGCTRPVDQAEAVPVPSPPSIGTTTTTTVLPASSSPSSTTSTTTTSTSTTTTSTSTSTTLAPTDCVARLPLEWRAGQVLMPAVYGDGLDAGERLVDESSIGGVVLMTWPDGADPARLAALERRSSVPLLIATDEEGGNVQRLRSLGRLPSPRDVAATMSPEEAEAMVAEHARLVAALGIDLVLGPVVDVGSAAPIGSRSFGDDPDTVAAFAEAYVRGWSSAGITPVLKHFPGHGRATADTHDGPASTPTLDELSDHEFVPYRRLAEWPGVAVMVGHLDTPGLTDGAPASLSPAAIDLLRSFGRRDTLVVTDALDMGAVSATHDLPAAVVAALVAGADIALFTDWARTSEVVGAVADAVRIGTLPEARLDEAVARVLTRKGVDGCSLG